MHTPIVPKTTAAEPRFLAPRDGLSQIQSATRAQATTSSSTTERDTPHTHEQRIERSSAYLMKFGTSAYMQAPASKSLQRQGFPDNGLATTRSNSMDRELLGIGTQFDGINIMRQPRGIAQSDPVLMCPRHDRIPQKRSQDHNIGRGLGPMDRYLAEGSSDRSSMPQQRYHEDLNARQNCRCTRMMQSDGRTRK
ncbi:MAG: hypothetical protein Q9195_002328 [Heterodermia aff. obscurata]